MGILATTIISALVPIFGETVRNGFNAIVGRIAGTAGVKPANIDEQIRLMNAETAKAQALAALDTVPDGAKLHPFIVNMRAGTRYLLSWAVILTTLAVVASNAVIDPVKATVLMELAASVWGFLFGDRIRVSWQSRGK